MLKNIPLNEAQQQAVNTITGPLLIIAGAGSGKTRVITTRIASLIEHHNVAPSSIVALTFTNKAAREMKERITGMLPDLQNLPFIGTFHSYCIQLLKKYQSFANLENFSILDSDDQAKLLKLIAQQHALEKKINISQLQYQISLFKNSRFLEEDYSFFEDKLFQDIFLRYEQNKRTQKVIDFDDILIETVKLLRKNPVIKEQFQSRVQHILVDEYQDTSHVQHALLKEFTKHNDELRAASVCVVGDEDQSIYSWRGATVDNMLYFKKDFPGTKIIKIEQNYRSVNQILEVANRLIEQNSQRNPKKLWSAKEGSNRVAALTLFSGFKEGDLVAHFVKMLTTTKPTESVAVLYRTHFQSRALEESLLKASIPYTIIGGIQFYERKEIKDMLAYLKLSVNPFDKISLLRILNCPARNLGAKSEELLYAAWEENPLLDFRQLIQHVIQQGLMSGKKSESLQAFGHLFDDLHAGLAPADAIKAILAKTNYIDYLKEEYEKAEYEQKIENVQELLRAAQFAQEKGIGTTEGFLHEIALMQEKLHEQQEEQEMVQLMTLHAAKGLEFDNVIITGLEEGLLPSARSMQDPLAIEEERRLFYVGITRARERLILTNAQIRNSFGQTANQLSSRFLGELPREHVVYHDATYWHEHDFIRFTQQFLTGMVSTVQKPAVQTFGKPKATPSFMQQEKLEPTSFRSSVVTEWKKNHFVSHAAFGTGIIKEIEEKPNGSIVITAHFKTAGLKKVDSKFLKHL